MEFSRVDDFLVKVVLSLGVPGLTLFLSYKLIDKHAAKFIAEFAAFNKATAEQAQSMATVAALSQGHREEQREVAMALRVLSKQMEQMGARVKEIGEKVTG